MGSRRGNENEGGEAGSCCVCWFENMVQSSAMEGVLEDDIGAVNGCGDRCCSEECRRLGLFDLDLDFVVVRGNSADLSSGDGEVDAAFLSRSSNRFFSFFPDDEVSKAQSRRA